MSEYNALCMYFLFITLIIYVVNTFVCIRLIYIKCDKAMILANIV